MPSVTQNSVSFATLDAYSACAPHHLNTLKFPHSCEFLFVWLVRLQMLLASALVKL